MMRTALGKTLARIRQELRRKALTPALLAVALSACTSVQNADSGSAPADGSSGMGATAGKTIQRTGEGLADAALSPLEDLNLKRDPIPALLEDVESPYQVEGLAIMTCTDIAVRVALLDGILGADWDYLPPEDEEMSDEQRSERRAEQVSDATLGLVSSEARGFIPFRGAVRYVTGASRHEKELVRALTLGAQQRAFLKGVGLARGCAAPAAPNPFVPKEETAIVFKGDKPLE